MPDKPDPESKGSQWFKELYDLFAPARESLAESGMTDEEINAEIDAAIREVRAEQRKNPRSTEDRLRELWESGVLSPELARRLGLT